MKRSSPGKIIRHSLALHPLARDRIVVLTALLGACTPDGAVGDREAIVAATRFAYALEDSADARRAALRTRDDLLALFAQGFEPPIAARLTDRLWDPQRREVLGTEQSLASPESVVVLVMHDDSAVVAFTTPTNARWAPDAPYTLAWLRRRDDVWRVAAARDTTHVSAPLPSPEPMPEPAP